MSEQPRYSLIFALIGQKWLHGGYIERADNGKSKEKRRARPRRSV